MGPSDSTFRLDAVIPALTPYDPVDLLTAVAGLQLIPENAERTNRLIALAHAAASVPDIPGKPIITPRHLKRLCTAPPLTRGEIAESEDPYENPFTEAFTFFDGSYTVFPGPFEEATFVLRHLAKALFLRKDPFPDPAYVEDARDILLAAVALGDEVARRAGLGRSLAPVSVPGPGVVVPDAARMQQLQAAVSFDVPWIEEFLRRHDLSLSALDALTSTQGSVSIAAYHVDQGALLRQPLVREGDRLTVALPSLLVPAARHAILCLAVKRGVADEVAARYTEAVWGAVEEALRNTNNLPSGWIWGRLDGLPFSRHGLFHLDTDKLLYVVLVTDPLTNYRDDAVFGEWPIADLAEVLQERLRAATQTICSLGHPPSDILLLALVQGVGRLWQIVFRTPLDSPAPELLAMSAADLETITYLERGDQLALWKYGRARAHAWRRGGVVAPTALDEFAFYRMNHHSFFSPDMAMSPPPVVLGLRPGGAGHLRWTVLQERDWHAAPAYRAGAMTEVVSRQGTRDIPIYVERGSIQHRLSLLVEGLPLPVWVIGDRSSGSTIPGGPPEWESSSAPDGPTQAQLYDRASIFVDAAAYWLWQCTSSLQALLALLAARLPRVLIRLRLDASDAWQTAFTPERSAKGERDSEPWRWRANRAGGILQVMLFPEIRALLATPDNHGDRAFLLMLLHGLRSLLSPDEQDEWPNSSLAEMVERHAPLGLKKMLIALPEISPDLDPHGLPPARTVQEADIQEVEDDLGTYLVADSSFAPVIIPPDQRQEVLTDLDMRDYSMLA